MCPYKINSTGNRELNARAKVIRLHEENVEGNPYGLALYIQRVLKYDTKSIVHKREKMINWTSSK